MDIAALIISIISLISSLACLVIMLAKNFFSTHQVQLQPIDPFSGIFPQEMGKPKLDPYQDFDLPLDEDDIEQLKGKKAKF